MSYKPISLFLSTFVLWTCAVAQAQVSPAQATLGPSQQQQFSLGGQQPKWQVVPVGNGTITSTGLYTAPAVYSSNYAYVYARVGAYSYQAQVNLVRASISLPGSPSSSGGSSVSISVSPTSVFVAAGQSQQFAALVTGSTNQQVAWSVLQGLGYIVNGLYHAPSWVTVDSLVTIMATSLADPTQTATATITIGPAITTTSAGSGGSSDSPPTTFTPIRVRAGAGRYVDPQGLVWAADYGFSGATATYGTAAAISGTTSPALYQYERYGRDFQYSFPVPNGTYTVTLKFAETFYAAAGDRVFNVVINNQPVLTSFDIFAQAGGENQAIDESFSVPVTSGAINIEFVGIVKNAQINAIQILDPQSSDSPPPTSVSPATASVAPSGTKQFSVLNLPSGVGVNWSVSPTTGSISTSGLYTAPNSVATQTAITVTATNSSTLAVLGTASLTLQASPPPTSVSPATATVAPSGTRQFSVLNLPSGVSVSWSVSPTTGSISASGLYSAPSSVATQTAITVTAANSSTLAVLGSASLTLQASPPPPPTSVSPATASVAPSGTKQFSVLNLPSGVSVSWSVSPTTGSISTSGLYSAPSSVATQTTITVTAANSSTLAVLGTASLTLKASPPPTSVSPATATVGPSGTKQFSVENLPSGVSVIWSVSPTTGSISTSGLYTGPITVATQTAITVTAKNSSTLAVLGTASITLTASPTPPSVSPATASVAPSGTKQFSVENLPSGVSVSWSMSPKSGSISTSGLYTAPSSVATQTAITVTARNSSTLAVLGTASLTLEASPPPPTSVSPATATVAPSGTKQFLVENLPSGVSVSWSVSPTTGSISTSGLYSAPTTVATQTTITVTATNSSTLDVLGTATLTLKASPPPTSVSPATASVAPSGTKQFSVENLPSGVSVSWSMSPKSGSISGSGLYSAPSSVATQTAITVTAKNSSTLAVLGTASLTLEASPPPPTSVSPATATVAPSGTKQFSVENLPSGVSVSWSVSPTTGSISTSGLYSAPTTVATQTTITVTATNSSTLDVLGTATLTLKASPPPTSVSPATASVAPSGTKQFSVENLPSGVSVSWSMSPKSGSISGSGLYSAPSSVATQTAITVTAKNSSTLAVLGTASLTLEASPPPPASVSPTTASVAPSGTQQFSVLNLPSGVSVSWAVSPTTGSISTSGLYTAPTTVAAQTAITVTATNSSTLAVLGTATLTLQPSAPTGIVLPVEVLGTSATTVPVSFSIPSGSNLSGRLQLWLQIHGLEYQTQASVKVNSGAWIPINDSTVTYQGYSAKFGGIGGGFSTLQLTINLPGGSIQTGQNTLTFSFNGTDGISSGFRVLNLNILAANGTQLISQSSFTQDDPSMWAPPLTDSADIQAGQTLFQTAALSVPGTGAIQAKCGNCHTQDGRDLKYFNYSNLSIETRAMFHGLTAQQGAQIASYIRTMNAPVSSYARPWNPPYQPGPGMDSRPVSDWSAGAGLSAVLDADSDSLAYILPGGSTANLAQSGYMNQREIPIALQLRDWNHWLPTVYPGDAFGSQFSDSGLISEYVLLRTELIPNDATTYQEHYLDILRWASNQNGLFAAVRQPPTSAAWNNPVYDREIYSVAQWLMVKSWELNHEYGLEGMAKVVFAARAASDASLLPANPAPTADRAWFTDQAFLTSPEMLQIPAPSPGLGNGTVIAEVYDAFIWYQTQLILNDGNGTAVGTWPIDWGYTLSYLTNSLTWDGELGQPRVGTAGLIMEWLSKILQSGADLPNASPYHLTIYPGIVSTWSELPSSQKVQLMNDWVSTFLGNVQGQTTAQLFTAPGITPTFNSLAPGSFTGDLTLSLPLLRFEGVDPNLLNQLATWASGIWPTYNWMADLDSNCSSVGGGWGTVTCP